MATGNTPGGSSSQNGSRAPVADMKELGGQLAGAARNGANSLYEEQRDRAADEIAALGQALGRSAGTLNGAIGEAIAPYAQQAARQVGGFADTLRHRSLADVGSDIEGFARQWPTAFIAASIGLGFIAGRFLFSSGAPIGDAVSGNAGMTSSPMPSSPMPSSPMPSSAKMVAPVAQKPAGTASVNRIGQNAKPEAERT